MVPASTMPANFAGGDTSIMSSTTPTAVMITAAKAIPSGSDDEPNTPLNWGMKLATANPTSTATHMATPPSCGVGAKCTRRWASGWATTP